MRRGVHIDFEVRQMARIEMILGEEEKEKGKIK